MATTATTPRKRTATPRLSDEERASIIADKVETRARIDQLNRSLAKLYRRLDYLTHLAPDHD